MTVEVSKHRVARELDVASELELAQVILEISPVDTIPIAKAILAHFIVLKVNQEATRS